MMTITNRAEIEGVVDRKLRRSAESIIRSAKRIVPVDTGQLQASLTIKRDGEGYAAGSDIDYAHVAIPSLETALGDAESEIQMEWSRR